MPELELAREELLSLRARAHNLDPVVLVGNAGFSEAVVKEVDRALAAHGLVKVRAGRLEGEEREATYAALADRLGAARVQAIGHLLVLYRPVPGGEDKEAPRPPVRRRAPRVPKKVAGNAPAGNGRRAPHR